MVEPLTDTVGVVVTIAADETVAGDVVEFGPEPPLYTLAAQAQRSSTALKTPPFIIGPIHHTILIPVQEARTCWQVIHCTRH